MAFSLHDNAPQDEVIRGTNDDATISRLSAVNLGYFKDPFVQFFVKRPIRRSPIINRGSYIRNYALDQLVRQFLNLDTPKKKQIIALGAGFDTRYFLMKSGQWGDCSQLSKYFEVDFPEIVVKKAMTIKRRAQLNDLIQNVRIEKGGIEFASDEYFLIGGDLREWSDIVERLVHYGFDTSAPTLVLSECVLIYLEPEHSSTILDWMTQQLLDCMFVLYEQIRPTDSFGKVMIRNLQSRRIELKGIHAYPELKDQETRFTRLGWDGAKAVDTKAIHDQYLERSDISRMARLEILDELEEWHLLAAHYCVAWAFKSATAKSQFASVQLDRTHQ
ncbi:S-adenosyl-L-methionine-dependent methyltransferase [Phascolomyces articulosus]|uniref:Leucine carboxyl methyltransferase 1 n=1 Tax=Phascolomyces articulosus TaxID=60185 RepID=A0AAD5PC63_9FUNG|nr:S-adenosyl-L-methionine-dependent methyltransferase [Phascolomyces articulosus]